MSTDYLMQQNAAVNLNPQHSLAIRYYCLGDPAELAASKAGISVTALRKVAASDPGKAEILRIRSELDEEFLNLQSFVNEAIRDGLQSDSVEVVMASANMWLRAAKAKEVKITVTAEDIIQKIFTQGFEAGRHDKQLNSIDLTSLT